MLPAFAQEDSQGVIEGPAGQLEVMTTWTDSEHACVAIICHPHPLHHGSMHNKVVSTIAKACDQMGMPTVRFNFRGVGKSEGVHDYAVGEQDDLRAVIAWVKQALPGYDICLAGFSFGAFISASVAQDIRPRLLMSIAPAVNHADFTTLHNMPLPWLVVHGDSDDVVPCAPVKAWVECSALGMDFEVMEGAGHFFHGRLIELRALLFDWLKCNLL